MNQKYLLPVSVLRTISIYFSIYCLLIQLCLDEKIFNMRTRTFYRTKNHPNCLSEYCESRTKKPFSVHLHAFFYLGDSQQRRVSEREEEVCLAGTLLRAAWIKSSQRRLRSILSQPVRIELSRWRWNLLEKTSRLIKN